MQVASTVMLQLGELSLALSLLQYTAKPHQDIMTFFARKFSLQRSWVKETVLGLGLLMTMVFLTSFIDDKLVSQVSAVQTLNFESSCHTYFPPLQTVHQSSSVVLP